MMQKKFEIGEDSFFYKQNILFTKESDMALIKKIRKGDNKARNELVLKHLGFAIFFAKLHQNKKNDLEDLVQDSLEGIIKAADRVDLKYKNKFLTYARWYAFGQLKLTLDAPETGVVISRFRKDSFDKYTKEKNEAEKLNKPFKINPKMERVGALQQKISIENFVDLEGYYNSESRVLPDFVENCDKEFMIQDILNVLEKLSKTEREVLILHYGLFGNDSKTFEEISTMFNKSKTWAQYVEKKALNNIKQKYPYLKDYLIGA